MSLPEEHLVFNNMGLSQQPLPIRDCNRKKMSQRSFDKHLRVSKKKEMLSGYQCNHITHFVELKPHDCQRYINDYHSSDACGKWRILKSHIRYETWVGAHNCLRTGFKYYLQTKQGVWFNVCKRQLAYVFQIDKSVIDRFQAIYLKKLPLETYNSNVSKNRHVLSRDVVTLVN